MKHTPAWQGQDWERHNNMPDYHAQMTAIRLDWSVERRSLYDEEGVEGWAWIEPDGTEHVEIGLWDEPIPWPDSAREALSITLEKRKE